MLRRSFFGALAALPLAALAKPTKPLAPPLRVCTGVRWHGKSLVAEYRELRTYELCESKQQAEEVLSFEECG